VFKIPTVLQIRTEDMDLIAEIGIAAHYSGRGVVSGPVRPGISSGRNAKGKVICLNNTRFDGRRRDGRDGSRGRCGRGFGNKQSAGTPSAGTTHPVIVKLTAFWFENFFCRTVVSCCKKLELAVVLPFICTGKKTTFGDD
jgi:hypothetical protein